MAKTHKLSSEWSVKNGVLALTIEARDPGADKDAAALASFTREVNLASTFGEGYTSLNEAGQAAIEFGVFTALRNSTGSADTLDEAAAAIDRRLDAFAEGSWGAEREGMATPFTASALIALAVERATKGAQSAAVAAEKLSELAHATCKQNGTAEFAKLDANERAKIRKAIVDHIKQSKPIIAAALAQIEAERAAEAAKRKAEAAAKKLAASAEEVDAGL